MIINHELFLQPPRAGFGKLLYTITAQPATNNSAQFLKKSKQAHLQDTVCEKLLLKNNRHHRQKHTSLKQCRPGESSSGGITAV